MSLLLGLVAMFSRLTSCTLRPAVFFSSTARLFDNELAESREKVRAELRQQGLTDRIHTTASDFNKKDLEALGVSFQPALKCHVLPDDVEVTGFPDKYALPKIDIQTITDRKFNVDNLKEISDTQVKAFLIDLNEVSRNLGSDEGMDESVTDTLLTTLLVQVLGLHNHPLRVRQHLRCRLYILSEPYVTARPEFVVNRGNTSMIVVEDKHLRTKNLIYSKGHGEAQMAAEILACGNENIRQIDRQTGVISDQTIFGVRAISSYFTFYKTVISSKYWDELDFSLPQQESVLIKRWPQRERPETGLDIATPDGRREVLEALARIRQFLLQ
ncbi:11979_t:CDS:2 [Ambispora leptoticha]|uniref:11979_t:CDS:1 n=1 Tax=Ambispora leptoticha TaxID=144679 RepID=A0A9N9CGX6_9GLOM|nr:11979_t:CDS:2 [Ambispora leptoticha]